MRSKWTKTHTFVALIPILFLLIGMGLLVYFNVSKYFNFTFLQQKHAELSQFLKDYPLLFTLGYLMIYILSVCLIIPDAILLNFFAGIFYPLPVALPLVIFGETIGSLCFFLIIRYALQDFLFQRKVFELKSARAHYNEGPASYLLFFRFSHLLPAWLLSFIAVTFKTRGWTYVWTTAVGLFPAIYLTVETGHSIGLSLKNGAHTSLELFDARTKLLFFALALLALVPLFFKRWRKKSN